MKKFIIFLSAALFAVYITSFIVADRAYVFAEEDPTVYSVEAVFPDSPEQLFPLSFPVDVDGDGDDFLILENDEHDPSNNKLNVYRNGEYISYALSYIKNEVRTYFDATEARFFMGRILFLSNSRIYLIDEENSTETDVVAIDTGMVAATSFSVSGNKVLTNTSSGIDGYSATETDGNLIFTNVSSLPLGFSPETVVLIKENSAFYFYTRNIIFIDPKMSADNAAAQPDPVSFFGDARYAVYHDDSIYYSIENGIFRFNVTTFENTRVNTLPHGADVQGLAFFNDKLVAALKGEKAVREISLTEDSVDNENYTLYAITARTDLINRLTANVSDFAFSDGKLFVLDGKILKVKSLKDNCYYRYDLGEFVASDSVITDIAAAGERVAIIETKNENSAVIVFELSNELKVLKRFEEFSNATAITASEGDFYLINNKAKVNTDTKYAEVFRITAENATESVYSALGLGWQLHVDLFGEIFMTLVNDGKTYLWSSRRDALLETEDKPTDIFSDFNGNVYYLLDGTLYYFDGENANKINFSLFKNAPENSVLISIEHVELSDEVYILYNGFIVKSVIGDMLTPFKIAPPEDFSLDIPVEFSTVAIDEGSKLFEISTDISKEFVAFDYSGYKAKTGNGIFVLIREFDNYAVIADGNGTYLVRRDEYLSAAPATLYPTYSTAYLTNDVSAYKIPVLSGEYAAFTLQNNEEITVIANYNFNGIDYSLIVSEDNKGYIPTAFLKGGVADVTEPIDYERATVAKRGATVYSDAELTAELTTLSDGDVVYIVEETDNYIKIVYEDGFAYLPVGTLETKTYYAVRNLIVILLLFVALFSSTVFVLKTRVFKCKDEE